jgi:hypothetical protein
MEDGMDSQERQVIDGIFDRLKNVENQPRDAEAERYIADLVQRQPYAPYALAQSVYVQEQALLNQQREIEALRAQVQDMQSRPAPAQAAGGGGFLSGLFGGGQPARPQAATPQYGAPRQAPAAGPWGQQPQAAAPGPWGGQAAQPRQGMGFLGTAAAAAAGVAGGMVLGSILSSALGGGAAQAAQNEAQGLLGEPAQDQQADQGYDDASADGGWDDGGFGDDSYEA